MPGIRHTMPSTECRKLKSAVPSQWLLQVTQQRKVSSWLIYGLSS